MQKLYSRASSSSGFTILELLVASSLGLIVVALSLVTLTSERNLYKHDIVRTRINQSLRSAIDIMGMNIREAGEALPDYFPAIEVINGTGSAPDELIIRRNLYENEIFNLCQTVNANFITPSILVAYNTTVSGCVYSSAYSTFNSTWQSYRVSQGGTTPAYIYDRSNRRGEFFNLLGGVDSGSQITLNRDSVKWANTYVGNGTTAALYIIEEFRFRVQNGLLQMIKNGDFTKPLNVVDQISNFQVNLTMSDGTIDNDFGAADDWTDIRSLNLTLNGSDTYAGSTLATAVTVQIFPRNILSH